MKRLEALEVDDHILEKIQVKHGVSFDEAEEVCLSASAHVRRDRSGLYKFFGQTEAGRYLLVMLAEGDGRTWRLVTARDMTNKERRLFASRRK